MATLFQRVGRLFDWRGRRVDQGALLEEQGEALTGHVRAPERRSVATTLTPSSLATLMRAADQGNVEAMFILAEEIEEREPHTSAQLQQRTLSVQNLARSVVPGGPDADDEELAADVTETILEKPAFDGLLVDLQDAVFKGLSCIEIMWERGGKRWEPVGYEFRPQRHFVFDREQLKHPRLRTDQHPTYGEELAPFKWIVHTPKIKSGVPLRRGLVRPVSLCYAAKRYTIQDLLAFMDIYGQPIRVGRYPAHLKQHKTALLQTLRAIGTDASAVIPEEMAIELLEARASSGGDNVFLASADYWDKQVSKVINGQTMTSDEGSSRSQSETHQDTKNEIRDADAAACFNTLNEQLTRVFVELNYGPRDRYPRIHLGSPEVADAGLYIDNVTKFIAIGGRVKQEEVYERMGYAQPDDDDEVFEKAAPPVDPETGLPLDPNAPPTPPGQDPGDDDEQPPARALNSARFNKAAEERTEDEVDQQSAKALDDWRPMVNDNVGVLLTRLREAESPEAARDILDDADELDVAKLTAALARATFRMRGVGDATDEQEV